MRLSTFWSIIGALFVFASLVYLVVLSLMLINCGLRDGILVWGNTFRFGFTTYELQCYVGWFA